MRILSAAVAVVLFASPLHAQQGRMMAIRLGPSPMMSPETSDSTRGWQESNRGSHAGKGALIGAGIGIVAGAGIALAIDPGDLSRGTQVALLAGAFGVIGAGVGFFVGSFAVRSGKLDAVRFSVGMMPIWSKQESHRLGLRVGWSSSLPPPR